VALRRRRNAAVPATHVHRAVKRRRRREAHHRPTHWGLDRDVGNLSVRRARVPGVAAPAAHRHANRHREDGVIAVLWHGVAVEIARAEIRGADEEPARAVVRAEHGRRQRCPAGVPTAVAPVDPGGAPGRVGHPHPAIGRVEPPAPVVKRGPAERQGARERPPCFGRDPAPMRGVRLEVLADHRHRRAKGTHAIGRDPVAIGRECWLERLHRGHGGHLDRLGVVSDGRLVDRLFVLEFGGLRPLLLWRRHLRRRGHLREGRDTDQRQHD
jgi:hypothetical protein